MFDYILKAGDRVRMNMNYDTRQLIKATIPNGTLGTIIGKLRCHNLITPRWPVSRFEPEGVYSNDGVLIIEWDEYPEGMDREDPHHNRVSAVHLEPADSFFKEYTQRYTELWPVRLPSGEHNPDFNVTETGNRLDNLERTGDLPETPLWELDIVSYQGGRYRITRISYNSWGEERRHCYSMEEIDENGEYMRGGSVTVEPNELTLIERGNLWKERHGEPTSFRSLEEEVKFETGMARAHDVRNPKNNLYSWNLEEALSAIKEGVGDGLVVRNGFFGGNNYEMVMRLDNREIGERLRQKTLEGFNH